MVFRNNRKHSNDRDENLAVRPALRPNSLVEEKEQQMSVAQEIVRIFETRGASSYLGEPVSQLEHALQTAHHARQARASESLVAAALLHDIGHLLEDIAEEAAERGIDARHEVVGQTWLERRFAPQVHEPVRLHVAAKRYLCATDRAYLAQLSEASILSLKVQGGPMSSAQVAEFEGHRFFLDAVRLRRWDDLAKVKGAEVPLLSHYLAEIEKVARPCDPEKSFSVTER
jgi:[1-hydroxy-2-(trimethylamino)ethyl]phosphonate dioxygenase